MLPLLPTLLACAPGWIEVDGAREPLRAAMTLDDGAQTWLVLLNSDAPCGPTAEDRPRTAEDEAAVATAWWLGQLRTALTREGAAVVRVLLPGPGAWTIGPDPSLSPASALWYRVLEAEATQQADLQTTYLPTEIEGGVGTGEIALNPDHTGTLDLGALTAAFTAAPCDNAALPALAAAILGEFVK